MREKKDLYIRQVKQHLHLPGKAKQEILRDLHEIFASALEHGETQQQVTERLGPPAAFARQAAESLGYDASSAPDQKWMLSSAAALLLAVISFVLFGIAQLESVPEDAIGQANSMTNIRVEGTYGIAPAHLLLVIGIMAAAFAVFATGYRIVRKRRNT